MYKLNGLIEYMPVNVPVFYGNLPGLRLPDYYALYYLPN